MPLLSLLLSTYIEPTHFSSSHFYRFFFPLSLSRSFAFLLSFPSLLYKSNGFINNKSLIFNRARRKQRINNKQHFQCEKKQNTNARLASNDLFTENFLITIYCMSIAYCRRCCFLHCFPSLWKWTCAAFTKSTPLFDANAQVCGALPTGKMAGTIARIQISLKKNPPNSHAFTQPTNLIESNWISFFGRLYR